MSKKINSNSFKTVAVALFAFAAMFAAGNSVAQNPGPGDPWYWDTITMYVRYTLPGASAPTDDTIIIPCKVYNSSITTGTWNGVTTSIGTGAKRLTNCVVDPYPTTKTVNYGLLGNYTHTYTVIPAIDAFWEYHLYAGYTKEPNTTSPAMNCHGYSTGKNVWLVDFAKLLQKDWEAPSYSFSDLWSSGSVIYGNDNHSAKIYDKMNLAVENNSILWLEYFTREKNGGSAIYKGGFNKYVPIPGASPEVELDLKMLLIHHDPLGLFFTGYSGGIITLNHFYKKK